MNSIFPKKRWGQHFLKDLNIAQKIVAPIVFDTYENVLEIGPGKGVLTQFLLQKKGNVYAIEIDEKAVLLLEKRFPKLKNKIITGDFLKLDIAKKFTTPLAIVGNFPYYISSQILFRTLAFRDQVPFFLGMFQEEVARRIVAAPNSKKYGILSVLVQTFYFAEYLFKVTPQCFYPPPKVFSGVVVLRRKENFKLKCNEKLYFKVVRLGFQKRRKTLRNSLKTIIKNVFLKENSIFDKRAEQLTIDDFIHLTLLIENEKI